MSKIIIVSNRLPLNIKIENDHLTIEPSVGGLATGMRSVHEAYESKWIGWTGLAEENLNSELRKKVNVAVEKEDCIAVDLSNEDVDLYYYGFSNKTIWPLFHYFTEFAEFKKEHWDAYCKVNQKFADVITKNCEKGDTIWIHDYQLLLLPQMIKDKCPDVSIGFFLHIPFPSYEVFRILPWRNELIEGMLGADLIGFHTYDYERHFFSSVRRLLGYEINFNKINIHNRIVKADSFPMGIDYDKFHNAALEHHSKSIRDKSDIQQQLDKHILNTPDIKLILSIDRLDYTKGIAKRLHAFEYFLEKYPEFQGKASLVMLAVPSRANVDQYQKMKSEIDELVGRMNGKFSTINWSPIWYFYRSFPFDNLIDLYTSCEIALLTPIRDGMNLVAKEFVASKVDKKGVLILSEMAGAVKEMSEALLINPQNYEQIADTLKKAIQMPEEEQIERNTIMQNRLQRYNIDRWASDFLNSLNKVLEDKAKYIAKEMSAAIVKKIQTAYNKAEKRIFFLDYDGTLVGFKDKPIDASPDKDLYGILDKLASNPKNEVVLISGRDKETFTQWFGNKNYTLIVEHGVWIKTPKDDWKLIEQMKIDWKENIKPIFEFYVDRTPGSFIEEKNYSFVWHYRKADPELGAIRANELKYDLSGLISNHNLEILEGNKVIEIKNSGINKGRAAMHKINNLHYDFIFGVGDDWTDEYLFHDLPAKAYTIRVGLKNTLAKYNVNEVKDVRGLLAKLSQ
ncbi:MAG: bifunctional alpha,alpha-trehalose-phosphate synthase (UDP-forming)/trehalose-phosphatase [Marinilabiliales bacterium]|nr:MAG: bifunctional alpha,alpha-trehalose-phosphate synthase (UDP-forming)/trehalose-phosphatase [Marinilabiliales bacterium]